MLSGEDSCAINEEEDLGLKETENRFAIVSRNSRKRKNRAIRKKAEEDVLKWVE